MTIKPIIRYFRSPTGAAFACRDNPPYADGDLLYKPYDSDRLRELASRGFGGSFNKYEASWFDPVSGLVMHVTYDNETFFYNHEHFVKQVVPQILTVDTLPDERQPEYLFRVAGPMGHPRDPPETLIYVSASKYHYSYESFRLFVGQNGLLMRFPVTAVDRYRDGGTTYVKAAEGVLYSPTSFKTDRKAMWRDQELVKLVPLEYEIHEDETSAWIKPR